ncbi:hypothetical protein KSS87_007954 [Heliosperma pusillum]|nr:hypothetical protein KSS87_007954 [Heliosperma pusillum]
MASTMSSTQEAEKTQALLLNEHKEKHFTAGEVVRDIIIGVSDGLTVPFALAAGLSGANASSSIILTAGIAEIAAGAISMGLGGYVYMSYCRFFNFSNSCIRRFYVLLLRVKESKVVLLLNVAKSEADHYARELKREQEEIIAVPDTEAAEIAEILSEYGIEPHEYNPVVNALRRKPQAWLEFMMKFELGLEKPDPRRALQSAFTIAISYIIGGIVPLFPYMFLEEAREAVSASVIVTLIALLVFGFAKGYFTGNKPFRSAFETAFIGAIASAAAFGMAKLVQG